MFTYPLIGNYGVSEECFQSGGVQAEGLVVREACIAPSHHLSKKTIYKLMEDAGKPGIAEVDTRMLTINNREHGTMRAALIVGSDDGEEAIQLARESPPISELDLISKVTCQAPYLVKGNGSPKNSKTVVLVDLGMKTQIIDSLVSRGINVQVVPASTSVNEIAGYEPDLLFFSNGPGDPQNATVAIKAIREFASELPIAGICLGHQVISLALGAKTYKLKFGHRGGNQPVKDLATSIVHITSQNHGFAVDSDSLEETELVITELNANDNTVEGVAHRDLDIFSVQYHPDAHPGPLDTEKLFFDKVCRAMGDDN
jgi:carbamoyl-phosphate synthase small subunit